MKLSLLKKFSLMVMALAILLMPISSSLGETNVLINADFEDWSDFKTLGSGWDQHNLYAGDEILRIDVEEAPNMVHSGIYAVQCALNGTDITHSSISQFYTPADGVTYNFSLWVLENNPHGNVVLKAEEFGNPSIFYYSADTVDSTSLQQISVTFIGTGNPFLFTIFLKNSLDEGHIVWMYIDDAVLTEYTISEFSESFLLLIPLAVLFGSIVIKKKK